MTERGEEPEADRLDQHRPLGDVTDPGDPDDIVPVDPGGTAEADEADLQEQRQVVGLDEEEHPD
ncbi:MAG TPA: hypothetical protein VK020_15845 [Microlunatus sp.]|nr:hypothetical protein [Microlunatus sp.]